MRGPSQGRRNGMRRAAQDTDERGFPAMATIYRALCTSVLLVWVYVVVTGFAVGADPTALAWHLRVGLVGTIVLAFVQSLPFAYFLGSHFWVKTFAKTARAGDDWTERQKLWMKGPAFKALSIAPLLTMAVAIAGSLVETGRIPPVVHPALVLAAVLSQLICLALVPAAMLRNAALMDELADKHQVPLPGTPEMQQLVEEEEAVALPPLFQLSRLAMLFGGQSVLLWLYLRFGTEGYRNAPALPFLLAACVLVSVGMGLNARYDPTSPRTSAQAWGRALAVGIPSLGVVIGIAFFI
jgi:hypothetical protein